MCARMMPPNDSTPAPDTLALSQLWLLATDTLIYLPGSCSDATSHLPRTTHSPGLGPQ